ncbi:MAG: hypothetical protein R2854_05660 [Caldilineaceae bacterium]
MTHAFDPTFEQLLAAAQQEEFSGWDFTRYADRWTEAAPTWDYAGLVRAAVAHADALLDMDTGGGEFLAALAPLPPMTVATENYPPNIPLAQARLEPLGVQVLFRRTTSIRPLPTAHFTSSTTGTAISGPRSCSGCCVQAGVSSPSRWAVTTGVPERGVGRAGHGVRRLPACTHGGRTEAARLSHRPDSGGVPGQHLPGRGHGRHLPAHHRVADPRFRRDRYRPQLYALHQRIRRTAASTPAPPLLIQAHKPA